MATARIVKPTNAISYQVSIRGKGIRRMRHAALTELVNRRIDGQPIPDGIEVRIQVWRAGHELDWEDGNHRAEQLRANLRRFLQRGEIELSVRETRK